MAGFDLQMPADNMSCIWLKGEYAWDYQQTAQALLALLGWQIFETSLTFPPISQVSCYLKSSILRVLRSSISDFFTCNRFPYQQNTVNQWFTISSKGDLRQQPINIINVDRNGIRRKCYTTQNKVTNFPEALRPSNNAYELFFHGTRHESAQDIIESGINPKKGDRKKDFSDGYGFYVGNNFDEAWNTRWAANRPSVSAVLVFRVKRTELREERNSLDLTHDKDQWKEVIRQFRSGRPERRFLRRLQEQDYEFIEGPMSSISGESQSFSNPTFDDNTYQLCVRHVNCAELFDRSLHSVVFFER